MSKVKTVWRRTRTAVYRNGCYWCSASSSNSARQRQTLLWFLEHGLQVPVSAPRDQVVWRRPRYTTIYSMLTNPAYAGAYAYGRTEHSMQYEQGQPRHRSRRKPRQQWWALIRDTHESYIGWKQFEEIQHTMTNNAHLGDRSGAAKRGSG